MHPEVIGVHRAAVSCRTVRGGRDSPRDNIEERRIYFDRARCLADSRTPARSRLVLRLWRPEETTEEAAQHRRVHSGHGTHPDDATPNRQFVV